VPQLLLVAAQCAHAAVGVVEDMRQTNKLLLSQWEEYGSAKIALKCPNQSQLVSTGADCERISSGCRVYLLFCYHAILPVVVLC